MLKPEYFDGKEQRMMELYQQLSEYVLKEAARFLVQAGEITPTADRLLQRLQLMGEAQAEIEKKLEQLTRLSRKSFAPCFRMLSSHRGRPMQRRSVR